MPFSSVINRTYLLILILKKIMCIYKLLIEKKTNAQMTHAHIIYDDCNQVRLLILSK